MGLLLKTLIKLLLWLVGLGAVALAALVVLVTTIDPNEHKGWIEAWFDRETGREISLEGPIAFTFYPWLGVEAAGVSIADVDGFGAEPFIYLDYFKLRVKSLPLLREEYEVDTVVASGAVVNLVRNERGVANWEDLVGATGEEEAGRPMLPAAALALGGVDIEDARVTLEDRQAALRYEFSDIEVSTAELRYGEPIDLRLGFRAPQRQAGAGRLRVPGWHHYLCRGRRAVRGRTAGPGCRDKEQRHSRRTGCRAVVRPG